MKTVAEIKKAFNPIGKLTPGQISSKNRLEKAYEDLALEVLELLPTDNADFGSAMRKLHDSKMCAVQALTHGTPPESRKKS